MADPAESVLENRQMQAARGAHISAIPVRRPGAQLEKVLAAGSKVGGKVKGSGLHTAVIRVLNCGYAADGRASPGIRQNPCD
jgi:hypothetical protein